MHLKPQRYEGIEGLDGRDPIGAALTIGRKGSSGAPTETDRFFFVQPVDTKVGDQRVRPLHPSFSAYNEADAKLRQSLKCNLVHERREDCFEHYLRAQVLSSKWPAHPQKRAACTGDGTKATRFFGFKEDKSEDWREIDSCGETCEFRIGDRKLCKPFARLLFRPRFDSGKFPSLLTKLTSGSWHSVSAMLGFFQFIDDLARGLGMQSYSLIGLPFVITLSTKTKPQAAQRFPVMSFSIDGDPVAFFLAQRENVRILSGGEPKLIPASLSDDEQQLPEIVASDLSSINHGHPIAKPAERDEVIDAEPVEPPHVRRIRVVAEAKGLTLDDVSRMVGAKIEDSPASFELEALRSIAESKKRK